MEVGPYVGETTRGVRPDCPFRRAPEAAGPGIDLQQTVDLVTTCILPSIGGDSNLDIEIRNGALTAIHRI